MDPRFLFDEFGRASRASREDLAFLPLIVLLMIGLGICIRDGKHRSHEARFLGAAIVVALVHRLPLIYSLSTWILDWWLNDRFWEHVFLGDEGFSTPAARIEWGRFLAGLPNAVLLTVEWALILWAFFGGEGGKRRRYLVEDASRKDRPLNEDPSP